MVLKSVNNAINSALSLLHELVVVLVGLDRMHVAGLMQQVAELSIDMLLFCHVNSEFGHNFLLGLEPLVQTLDLASPVGPNRALLIKSVR